MTSESEPLIARGYLCTGCWKRLPEAVLSVVQTAVGRDFRCGECAVGERVVYGPGEYARAEAELKAKARAAKA
jgi:hypothetical protein